MRKKINGDLIHIIWKPTCECDDTEAEVSPGHIADIGIPICPECGEEMEYSHVEISVDKHVVTYEDDDAYDKFVVQGPFENREVAVAFSEGMLLVNDSAIRDVQVVPYFPGKHDRFRH